VISKTIIKLPRRDFLKLGGIGIVGLSLPESCFGLSRIDNQNELLLYVGTYTTGKSEGIYLYRFNRTSGELNHVATTKGVVNPSFLTLGPKRRFLYAVNEVEEFQGKPSGAVSAFAIDQKSGELRFLNQQPTLGGAPCYVDVDDRGRFVLIANYAGGNVSVLPVQDDGRLRAVTDLKQDQGSSSNKERQEGPHSHCIVLDADNRFAYSCDLGTDKIMIYRFDKGNGKLVPNEQPFFQVKSGAGPRHLTFHPQQNYMYVLNELHSTVSAFVRDPKKGNLRELQTISSLPAEFKAENTGADIHISPDGQFLYCSNRGHDSIAAFKINSATGSLTPAGHTGTQGSTPRNFTIDPSGQFLLVANQNSNTIVVFRIDSKTGQLNANKNVAEVPSPVCLKFTRSFA
jgi:6-phosphogluconolactonase